VQKSVFKCKLDPGQMALLRARLAKIIDPEHDSLRFYNLGRRQSNREPSDRFEEISRWQHERNRFVLSQSSSHLGGAHLGQ
jgi:CRISPR associated protein Cas2